MTELERLKRLESLVQRLLARANELESRSGDLEHNALAQRNVDTMRRMGWIP